MASGITGRNFSTARMEEIASRVASLERIFNIKTGMGVDEDILPLRFQDESIMVGEKETKIPEDTIVKMRRDYYQARGWDENGVPREKQ